MPLRRFGRPGVLGTMARTAVVAGTATAVSGRVARRQQARAQQAELAAAQQQQQAWADQQQWAAQHAPAPPSPAPAGESVIEQLRELAALRDQGVLTDAEFEEQKARVLA